MGYTCNCNNNCSCYQVDTCSGNHADGHGPGGHAYKNCGYHYAGNCNGHKGASRGSNIGAFNIGQPIYASEIINLRNNIHKEVRFWGRSQSISNINQNNSITASAASSFSSVLNDIKLGATGNRINTSLNGLTDISGVNIGDIIYAADWNKLRLRLQTIIGSCSCYINCSCDFVCSGYFTCTCHSYAGYNGVGIGGTYNTGTLTDNLPTSETDRT